MLHVQDFGRNYAGDPKVKIPWVRRDLSGGRILVMEWIDGLRCTNPRGIQSSGIDVDEFIRCGVVSGLRQLLEVCATPGVLLLSSLSSTLSMVAFSSVADLHLLRRVLAIFYPSGTPAVRRWKRS